MKLYSDKDSSPDNMNKLNILVICMNTYVYVVKQVYKRKIPRCLIKHVQMV